MKSTLAALILTLASSQAFAVGMSVSPQHDSGDQAGIGIGFAGVPGLSVYDELGRDHFLQGAFGFGSHGSFEVTGDYAFDYRNAIKGAPILTPFWGLGAVALHEEDDRIVDDDGIASDNRRTYVGARIPLGMNLVIPKSPVQIAAEIAPSLLLTPATYSYIEGGLSVRVLF